MGMVLTEEQGMLRDAAREFVADRAPLSALRRLRDESDESGFSRDLWREMVELGWAGILIPEEFGGADFGFQGLGVVLEETGRALVASPLLSSVVLGGSAIALGGSAAQKADVLPAIASGERLLALALEETAHHAPYRIATRATASGEGFSLSGQKTFVLDGHVADQLIVVARTSGEVSARDGLTLFLVDAGARGVKTTRTTMVDSRNAANITLDGVDVGTDAIIGELDRGAEVLDAVLDRGRIALAAEMLGSAQEVFDFTLEYLKERHQFGQPIGTFQALQHRAVAMFGELEICRSVVMDALSAVDEERDDIPLMASFAKAKVGQVMHLISNEGVQMHGGIGMTDEHQSGFYLKRARVAEYTFGSPAWHRDRFASLSDF
jgi:alkylation response protein AidB-like acyl-CoA dehydrogenase